MDDNGEEIQCWGENVQVKVNVTNTRREPVYDLIGRLSRAGVKGNVTALMTLGQVRDVVECVRDGAPSCISVFAGRMADTGRDPVPMMRAAVEMLRLPPHTALLSASPPNLLHDF